MSGMREDYERGSGKNSITLACHVMMPTWEYVEWLEHQHVLLKELYLNQFRGNVEEARKLGIDI